MIRVQLYRDRRAVLDQTVETEAAGNALIDATINAIHKGQHGTGRFHLNADHVTADGLFMGVLWASPEFAHPVSAPAG